MMPRSIFAYIAALPAVVTALPATVRAADPVYPLASHVGLVAPSPMQPSQTFRGFEDKEAGAQILILEVPPKAFPDVEKQMSVEALKKQGMTEEKREPLTLKGGKGTLIVGQQVADNKKVRKWLLLASTNEVGALIAVQVPDAAKNKYSDNNVRAALMSTTMRATVPIDEQLTLLPITFDKTSALRPFRIIGNSTVFLTDGANDPPDVAAQPLLIISVAQGGPEQASDRNNFANNLFSSLNDFKEIRITGAEMLRLDNQQTHEIQATAKDAKTSTPLQLVQWIRFGNGAFIRFVGIARADVWKQAFPKFREVRDATKPRG